MCFKGRGKIFSFVLLSGFLALTACGDFLKGRKSEDRVIELSDDKFKCMNDLPNLVADFSAGEAKEPNIRASAGCLREALTYFRLRTKGSIQDAYSDEDLRKFFAKYFLKNQDISPEMVRGLMKLKKALFAGSETAVTKTEIDRLVTVLKVLEEELVHLAPHVKVLLGMEKRALVPEQLRRSISQARTSLQVLLRQVDLSRSDYNFNEAQELFSGLSAFAQAGKPNAAVSQIQEWVPLVEAVKNIFFGEDAALQGLRDWSQAVETVVSLYDITLQYNYFLKNNTFNSPRELKIALGFGDEILRLLENSAQMKRTGAIPFAAFDQLIDQVFGKNLLNLPLQAGTLKELYRKIVLGMLDPIRHGDTRGADSLQKIHLLSLRRELNIFRLNQTFADSTKADLTRDQLMRALTDFSAENALKSIVSDPAEKEAALAGWGKFRELLLKRRPVAFTPAGRAWITEDLQSLRWTWRSLTRLNLMHALVRGFMLGYGDDRDPIRAGCTEKEMIHWYADFQKAGIEMRAFDPRSGNSGARSFKEASFFTYSGNGDDRVDMDEMFEFVSFLVSGGLGNVNDIRTQMEARGCAVSETDIFGLKQFNESCLRKELRANFETLFDNLPGAVAYVKSLNNEQWEAFIGSWLAASRDSDPAKGLVETSDLRTATMIIHYSESLFTSYDANLDNRLGVEEIRLAAPRFMSFLKTISPVQYDSFITEAFVALVLTGKKPDAWGLSRYWGNNFLSWIGITNSTTADRGQLLRVFGTLRQELARPKAVQ